MAASDEDVAAGHTEGALEDELEEEVLTRSESAKAHRERLDDLSPASSVHILARGGKASAGSHTARPTSTGLSRTSSRHKLASVKAMDPLLCNKLRSAGHGNRKTSKGKKERAIQQARAFKELDITMEVLGIERNKVPSSLSAALERPGTAASDGWLTPGMREDAGVTPRASRTSSVRSVSAKRVTPPAPAEPLTLEDGSAQRPRSAKSMVHSPSYEKSLAQPWRQLSSPAPHHRRHSSGATAASALSAPVLAVPHVPSDKELQQLQADRENWQQELSNVLEGRLTLDDIEVTLQDATAHLEDLRGELVTLQDQHFQDWRACEQAVDFLEDGFRRAHDATRDLHAHIELLETSGKLQAFVDVLRDTMSEVLPVCEEVTAAAEAQLGGGVLVMVAGKEEEEVRAAFKVLRRMVELLREFAERCRTNAWHFPELEDTCASSQERAQELAVRLCSAALGAVSSLQGQVLRSESLSSEALAHRVSAQAKLLAIMWRLMWDLVGKTSRSFFPVKISLNKELCQLYLQAASDAEEMQKAVLPDSDSDEDISRPGYATASVWGSTAARARTVAQVGANGSKSPTPSDDQQAQEIQAQGWVPGLLQSLLHRAQEAHVFMQDELARRDRDQDSGIATHPDLSEGEEDEVCDLLDLMQDSFCHLALANTRRTAHLCAAPQLLPFWALEILKEQSEAALRLVQEYDRSSLGPTNILADAPSDQQLGLQLFQQLRHWTDNVINGHLRVKRLLKMKRADGEYSPSSAPSTPLSQRRPAATPARASNLPPAGPKSTGRGSSGAAAGVQGQGASTGSMPSTSQAAGGPASSSRGGRGAGIGSPGHGGDGSRGGRGGRGGTAPLSPEGRPPAQPRIVQDSDGWSSVSSRRAASEGRPPLQPRGGESNSRDPKPPSERRFGGRGSGGGVDGARGGGSSMSGRGRSRSSHTSQRDDGTAYRDAGRGGQGGRQGRGGSALLTNGQPKQAAGPAQQQKQQQQQQWQQWQQQQAQQQWVSMAGSPPSIAGSTPGSTPPAASPPQPAAHAIFLNGRPAATADPAQSQSQAHSQSQAALAERAASNSAASSSSSPAIPFPSRPTSRRHSSNSQRYGPQPKLGSSPADGHDSGSLFDATLGTPPSAHASRSVSPPPMLLATSPTAQIATGSWVRAGTTAPAKAGTGTGGLAGTPPALGNDTPANGGAAVSAAALAAATVGAALPPAPAAVPAAAASVAPAAAATIAATAARAPNRLPTLTATRQPSATQSFGASSVVEACMHTDCPHVPLRVDSFTGASPKAMYRFRMQTQQDKLQALLEIQDSDPPPESAMPAISNAPALGASWAAPAAPGMADQQLSYAARTASWAQVLSSQPQQAHGPDTGNSMTPFGTVSSQVITPASSQPLAPASSTSSSRSGKPSPFQSAAMAQLLSQGSGVLSERQCAEMAANAPGAAQQQQHSQQQHEQQRHQQQEQRQHEQQRQQVRQTSAPPSVAPSSLNATADGQQLQQSQQQQEQQRQEQKQERQHDQHQQDRRQHEQPVLQPAGPSRHLAVLRSIQACDDGFWKIRWKDLEPGLVKKLGSGSYGQVYQGVYLNAEVAIKVLNIDWDDTPGHGAGFGFSSDVLECFKQEVDFQRKLSFHPNVVRFVGACCEIPEAYLQEFSEGYSLACVPPEIARGVKLAIVMELCHLGSLYSMIAQARRTRVDLENGADIADVRRLRPYGLQFYKDWITRLEVARGAAAGVEYMHQHGVVHRDLTSYNLLLDFGKPWHVKVCDFNLSRMILDGRQLVNSGNPNSPGWQSPEMLAGRPYSKEADVFSFGVLLWEIVTLKEPWREETEGRQAGAPLYYIINSVTTGSRLSFPEPSELDHCLLEAAEIVQLAQQCWCHHPIERPTMSEVGVRLRDVIERLKIRRRGSSDSSIAGGSMRNSGLVRGGTPQALPTGSQQYQQQEQ